MNDYSIALSGDHAEIERRNAIDLYKTNLIASVFGPYKNRSRGAIEKAISSISSDPGYDVIHVMKDGIVAQKISNDTLEHLAWDKVEYVDLTSGDFNVRRSGSSSDSRMLSAIDKKDLSSLTLKWKVYQQRGDIPNSVVLIHPAKTSNVFRYVAISTAALILIALVAAAALHGASPR